MFKFLLETQNLWFKAKATCSCENNFTTEEKNYDQTFFWSYHPGNGDAHGLMSSVCQWSNPRLSHTDVALLSTQHYKVKIKALHHGVVAIKKGAFELLSTMVTNFTL